MSDELTRLEEELDSKIPRSAVDERQAGGGRTLSYLQGHYVIDRLNKVLGHLNWDKEILEVREIPGGKMPMYLAKVRLTVRYAHPVFGATAVVKEGYGYGSGKSDNHPHELAVKEAVTDALKVAAKDLGMSMGLALYSKDQENVDDEEAKPEPQRTLKAVSTPTPAVSAGSKAEAATAPSTDVADTAETVRSYVRLAEKKGVITREGFKEQLRNQYSVETVKELTKEQLTAVLDNLKQLTK
jgi:recombination DNA repair RAD52 pathway protein